MADASLGRTTPSPRLPELHVVGGAVMTHRSSSAVTVA